MKKIISLCLACVVLVSAFCSCSTKNANSGASSLRPNYDSIPLVESVLSGINSRNYPIIDGASFTEDLDKSIFNAVFPSQGSDSPRYPKTHSQTITSYYKLIDGTVDLILVQDPTEHVTSYAKQKNVDLEYVEIGNEALTFFTTQNNPQDNITQAQMQKVYSDNTITNWNQIGGQNKSIKIFAKNAGKHSQQMLIDDVLQAKSISNIFKDSSTNENLTIFNDVVNTYKDNSGYALGYTKYNFISQYMSTNTDKLKILKYNGLAP
ncbi:MAG: hypothetical protein Q8876_04120, partial [Bacillota bacterium]|nr:hypothetical protein [Bacillota bacterium]